MTKVTYIISDIDKALAFEWIAEYTDKNKITLSFILLNNGPSYLENFLNQREFEVHTVKCAGKKDWAGAIYKTYKLLKKIKPGVVHCHLITANIIGLTAAKLAGVQKRIYTRHHSSLHHVYFKKGIWWDKLANNLATKVIAISGIVKKILLEWEKVPSDKIIYIPHGFLLNAFDNITPERVRQVRDRHGIPENKFVVGVISRFTEWKGVQYIVPAFKAFLDNNPNSLLVLYNAQGDYEKEIHKLLHSLPAESYRLVPFENDIAAAYKTMNVFVHTPVDEHCEAFGQIYVEALASGIPSIFTMSGIASDIIKDERNAFVVPFKDSAMILEKLNFICNNPGLSTDTALEGKEDVMNKFGIDRMINALEQLYV